MAEPTERDPLIKKTLGPSPQAAQAAPISVQHKNGPLDISQSRRYGILAGIWSASFLYVGADTCELAEMLKSINRCYPRLLIVSLIM